MLNKFTWTDYILTVALLLVVYYLYVGLRYYFTEITELLSGKRTLFLRQEPAAQDKNSVPGENKSEVEIAAFQEETEDEHAEVERLIERLKTTIENGQAKDTTIEQSKTDLQQVFNEFPTLRNSPLRPSINELVVSECEKYGATISEVDVEMLWGD